MADGSPATHTDPTQSHPPPLVRHRFPTMQLLPLPLHCRQSQPPNPARHHYCAVYPARPGLHRYPDPDSASSAAPAAAPPPSSRPRGSAGSAACDRGVGRSCRACRQTGSRRTRSSRHRCPNSGSCAAGSECRPVWTVSGRKLLLVSASVVCRRCPWCLSSTLGLGLGLRDTLLRYVLVPKTSPEISTCRISRC